MSNKHIRNICYIGIARYIGETFVHSDKIVLREIATNLIEKSDLALNIFIKSSKYKKNVVELRKIEEKLNIFVSRTSIYFHTVEIIGLAIALLEDVLSELRYNKQAMIRKKAIEDLIDVLLALNIYFDRKFERSQFYDKAIEIAKIMEDIWDE